MLNFVKKNKMLVVAIIIAAVALYCIKTMKKAGGKAKYTVYGTEWCGYTTKQRDHLDSKYGKGSHTFVDCDKEGCPPDIKGFPVTVHNMTGERVEGFNTEL